MRRTQQSRETADEMNELAGNLDPDRPRKTIALVIELGRQIRPTITPNDPDTVERILSEQLAGNASGSSHV